MLRAPDPAYSALLAFTACAFLAAELIAWRGRTPRTRRVVIRVSRGTLHRHVFASVPLWGVFFLVGAIAFAFQWPPEADSVLRIAGLIAVVAAIGVIAVPMRLEPRWLSEERAAGFPMGSLA